MADRRPHQPIVCGQQDLDLGVLGTGDMQCIIGLQPYPFQLFPAINRQVAQRENLSCSSQ